MVAWSMSASSSTSSALLPPSSRDTFLSCPAAAWAIRRPTAVDPVKWIMATSGWLTSRSPASTSPGSTWKMPAGAPAAANSSAMASPPLYGVSGDGLTSTALPSARAGAMTRMPRTSGKFHGVMTPTSPSGIRSDNEKRPACPEGSTSPVAREASAAASVSSLAAAEIS